MSLGWESKEKKGVGKKRELAPGTYFLINLA